MKYSVIAKYIDFDSMIPHTEEEIIAEGLTKGEAEKVAEETRKSGRFTAVEIEEA